MDLSGPGIDVKLKERKKEWKTDLMRSLKVLTTNLSRRYV
jgi:hypothetical protein